MPPPQLPLTPLHSSDITAQDQPFHTPDMESAFVLPPPALHTTSSNTKKTSKAASKVSNMTGQHSPPPTPEDRTSSPKLQRKRTLSGSVRSKPDLSMMSPVGQMTNHDLPPPPSRARKIIQMKPKQSPSMTAQDQSAIATASGSSSSSSSTTKPSTAPSAKKAKSQPSATSAAGRKIARKTAHSIIERRRRSKMNEEFGVLKDMIPACSGIEMHKLAILQAGIEYLRYLEGCINKLKERNEHLEAVTDQEQTRKVADDMEVDDETEHEEIPQGSRASSAAFTEERVSSDGQVSFRIHQPQHPSRDPRASPSVATSAANSTFASPNLRPINSSTSIYNAVHRPSVSQSSYSTLPPIMTYQKPNYAQSFTGERSVPSSPLAFQPPLMTTSSRHHTNTNNTPTATPFGTLATGISPAIHAFHFSPDMTRASTYASSTPGTSISASSTTGYVAGDGKASPHIALLPQAALPLPASSFRAVNSGGPEKSGHAEATATAALLMMGHDRRTSISLPSSQMSKEGTTESSKGKGMSVRDLLSS